jgi:hypothetical protein
MKIFSIKNSTEEHIIGSYPQTKGMSNGYDLKKSNSVWNIHNFTEPNFKPDLNSFQLYNSSKLTDVISTGLINASGFLISQKLFELLKKHRLPNHVFYIGEVISNDLKYEYRWFHLLEDFTSYIDYKSSNFMYKHPLAWRNDTPVEFRVESKEELIDYWKKIDSMKDIYPIHLTLNGDFDDMDLFSFSTFGKRIYVSERLKNSIEKDGILGFDIEPINFNFRIIN